MDKKQIYYIGFYVNKNESQNRLFQPSGVSKMSYIIDCLIEKGFFVNVISLCQSKNSFKWGCRYIDANSEQRYFASVGMSNLVAKLINYIYVYVNLFCILFTRKKSDVILIYHSVFLSTFIKYIRFLIRAKIIIEIEEIYAAAYSERGARVKKELNTLKGYNGYITVNNYLKSIFYSSNSVVCNGIYRFNEKSRACRDRHKLLYAGVISDKGSDVYLALDVMRYLPDDYELSIAGYGTDHNILQLNKEIEKLNEDKKRTACRYLGLLQGDQYDECLREHYYGLCTRVLSNENSDYTFPSKVLVYLTNGLVPICTPLNILQSSDISNMIVFAKSITPEDIASVIINESLSDKINIDNKLQELHENFCCSLYQII